MHLCGQDNVVYSQTELSDAVSATTPYFLSKHSGQLRIKLVTPTCRAEASAKAEALAKEEVLAHHFINVFTVWRCCSCSPLSPRTVILTPPSTLVNNAQPIVIRHRIYETEHLAKVDLPRRSALVSPPGGTRPNPLFCRRCC